MPRQRQLQPQAISSLLPHSDDTVDISFISGHDTMLRASRLPSIPRFRDYAPQSTFADRCHRILRHALISPWLARGFIIAARAALPSGADAVAGLARALRADAAHRALAYWRVLIRPDFLAPKMLRAAGDSR